MNEKAVEIARGAVESNVDTEGLTEDGIYAVAYNEAMSALATSRKFSFNEAQEAAEYVARNLAQP